MRVYVPTTWAALAADREEAVPAGTVGYAATHRLAGAVGAPAPAAASDEVLDELADLALAAAAEASLLLLGRSGDEAPRRAVLALEVPGSAVSDAADGEDEHPAAVLLAAGAPRSQVLSVLADDEGDVPRVRRALAVLDRDQDAAVALLDDVALGWFDPSEAG